MAASSAAQTSQAWPPESATVAAPYTPAPTAASVPATTKASAPAATTSASTDAGDDESTGVESVRYGDVTNAGAPVNPTTPQQAQHQALSLQDDEPEAYNAGNYDELIKELERRLAISKPLTKEELEKIRRRQKAQGIISGISDAVQAISNLAFTTQYAPNMYNAAEGMSAKARARFDKEKAERDAEDDRYMNYALQLGKARDAVDALRDKKRQQDIALQLKVNEDARRQAKAEHDAEVADIDLQIRLGRLSYEEGRARKMDAEARLAEAYAQHADERVVSEINRNNRTNRGGGSRSGGKKYYGTLNGVAYSTKADYDKALAQLADENDVADLEILEAKTAYGDKTSREVKRPKGAIAADAEAAARKKKGNPDYGKNTKALGL